MHKCIKLLTNNNYELNSCSFPLQIESYNKVDCRVMFEIVDYYSRKTASRVDNKS